MANSTIWPFKLRQQTSWEKIGDNSHTKLPKITRETCQKKITRETFIFTKAGSRHKIITQMADGICSLSCLLHDCWCAHFSIFLGEAPPKVRQGDSHSKADSTTIYISPPWRDVISIQKYWNHTSNGNKYDLQTWRMPSHDSPQCPQETLNNTYHSTNLHVQACKVCKNSVSLGHVKFLVLHLFSLNIYIQWKQEWLYSYKLTSSNEAPDYSTIMSQQTN